MKDDLEKLIEQLEELSNLENKDHIEIADIFGKFEFNTYSAMHLLATEIRDLKDRNYLEDLDD
jgi:hypothetical protein